MVLLLPRSLSLIGRQTNHVYWHQISSERSQYYCKWDKSGTVNPRLTDTRLIRTPQYYGQFDLSLGKESPCISINSTRLIRTLLFEPLVSALTGFDFNNFYFWLIFLTIHAQKTTVNNTLPRISAFIILLRTKIFRPVEKNLSGANIIWKVSVWMIR